MSDANREAFEKYAMDRHCWNRGMFAQHSIDDYYLHDDVENEWRAWEASRQHAEAERVKAFNEGLESAAIRLENGSFLHDEVPDFLLSKQAAKAIRAMKLPEHTNTEVTK